MNNNSDIYINLINKINCDLTFKENFLEFIKTYDGTNEKELDNLILSALSLMTAYADAKIKAEGYDKVVEIQKNFKEELADLKYEYNELKVGRIPDNNILAEGPVEESTQPGKELKK